MKMLRPLSLALAGSLLLGSFANAQTVATDPVGFLQPFATPAPSPQPPNMLANSETQVSVPFTRPPEFIGATSTATANTLTVSGTPWSTNQFVYNAGLNQHNTYFVLIGPHSTTNPKEGRAYQITSNTTNQLTVNNGGDDLSTVASTTQILVVPYNTLNSVFPASDANISYVTSTNFGPGRRTVIFIPPYGANGFNNAPTISYAYINGWKQFPDTATDHGDDALPNGGYVIVRNGATGTLLTTLGSVLTKKFTIPLLTVTDKQQDNFVSLIRPIDVALNDLGLITSGAFVASTNFGPGRRDTLLVFDPTQTALPKAPSATYAYIGGAWKKFPDTATDVGATDKIPAGAGFIIRKYQTATGAPSYWTNTPTY